MFLKKAINVFLIYHPEIKSANTKSLQKAFEVQEPMCLVMPDAVLSMISRGHAVDMSNHNTISHQSSDGRSFQQRLQPYIKECGSECIHAAQRYNSLEAILSLLFDFNVPDFGHRKSLLDPRFHRGGFGVSLNAKGNSLAVIDFSCQ